MKFEDKETIEFNSTMRSFELRPVVISKKKTED